jgi:hypothetical protein
MPSENQQAYNPANDSRGETPGFIDQGSKKNVPLLPSGSKKNVPLLLLPEGKIQFLSK